MNHAFQHVARVLLIAAVLMPVAAAQGSSLGFAEEFALAPSRSKALEQLIPGTQDYYYYRCLERQHARAFAEVPALLEAWIQRHGRGQRVVEIENRQALLLYGKSPAATYEFLKSRLDLTFDAQRELRGAKPDLPTRLDPDSLSWQFLAARALKAHPKSLDGFRNPALESLATNDLDDKLLASLLRRLTRPDIPNLPALVIRNLEARRGRVFGSLNIHKSMLLAQLDECARLSPRLLQQKAFIDAYVLRLRPNSDVQWQRDREIREAYLDRLEAFSRRLANTHNSFKAHVLHHRLTHDLAAGRFDKNRFLAYLRLPRRARYVNPEYIRRRGNSDEIANLGRSYATGLGIVRNDEPLVRTYLEHFFTTEDSIAPYAAYIRPTYLNRVLAETKILAGKGDQERWYSLLDDPSYYEALKDRVEITFAPSRRSHFAASDPVSMEVDIKNVQTLLVKVHEIDALSYYRAKGKEVDASIHVEGLLASDEKTHVYKESSLRRVRRNFHFSSLSRPGVYVVEFIGNGLSSRAVIRKGRLQYQERVGSAGHVFRVLDETGKHLPEAAIHLGSREYRADEDGEILIPFSTSPGEKTIVLNHDSLATLERFRHQGEKYTLRAGIYIDRESLIAGGRAKVLIRPTLLLNRVAISLSLLEDPVLTVESKDRNGVVATLEVGDLKLRSDRELVHEIQVPSDLSSVSVRLRGRLRNVTKNEPVELACRKVTFSLNRIESTPQTSSPLLARTSTGYVLDVLGKNGEPIPERAVKLTLRHRDFKERIQRTLKTDESGRIRLGHLPGITHLGASGLPNGYRTWSLVQTGLRYPRVIHATAGTVVRVPYQGRAEKTTRAAVSLFETRGGAFTHDAFDKVAILDGFVELRDLAAGNYDLMLKEVMQRIEVKITAGEVRDGWVIGTDRMLKLGDRTPLHISDLRVSRGDLVVQCKNFGRNTRVHVFSTRYLAPFNPLNHMSAPYPLTPGEMYARHAVSSYASGRSIDDEYRYILDRRYARKFPGNMLRRPGLLLNPWARDTTDATIGTGGGAGDAFGGRRGGRRRVGRGAGGPSAGRGLAPGLFSNLNFLPTGSKMLCNLAPDARGNVRVPLSSLGAGHELHAIAIDGPQTVYASHSLPASTLEPVDLRLAAALDPAKHYAEQKSIEFMDSGAKAIIANAATSRVETYDSLASVFKLYQSLGGGSDLAEFAFLLRWPKLDRAAQQELYSSHACHELNFFLHEKDPDFFAAVVRPFLANKLDKTFLDRWLLAEDLSSYLAPWAFARLNVVERILLTKRIESQADSGTRHIRDLLEMDPPTRIRVGFLFDSALVSNALEAGESMNGLPSKLAQGLRDARRPRPSPALGLSGLARKGRGDKPAEKKLEETEEIELEEEVEEPKGEADLEAPVLKDAEVTDHDEDRFLGDISKDKARRKASVRHYRAPHTTRRFVEHNYWHRDLGDQGSDMIAVNAFWRDFADSTPASSFFSTNFPQACGNFAEMVFALSVLDLPFESGKHTSEKEGDRFTLTAATPLLLVRKEIREARPAVDATPLLVSQAFFRLDDPYYFEGSERRDKHVTGNFLSGVAYGCRVVLTNPSSTPRKLELLLQIPEGAMPVRKGFETRGIPRSIGAYGTATIEYAFYFPKPGSYAHYPVHANSEGNLLAAAEPVRLEVLREPSDVDTKSWAHISQGGTDQQVMEHLEKANLFRIDLSKIAWRLRDPAFCKQVIDYLRNRHAYDQALWSYGLFHKDEATTREYMSNRTEYLARCGKYLDSPLLRIDPVERHAWQHIEYSPLFNPRAHPFGKRREIHNRDLENQYTSLLGILAYRPALDDSDWMSVTYYLLLQDRVEEALTAFARIDPKRLSMRMQYDYMRAYLDFFTEDHALARGIAEKYRDHPIKHWRVLFQDVLNQLDEAEGNAPVVSDATDRTQQQTAAAAREPSLALEVEARKVRLAYKNLESCQVRYYEMDIEFLFSRSPFVQQDSGAFAYVRANKKIDVQLPKDANHISFDLPEEYRNSNLLVEVRSGSIVKRQTYYANTLNVRLVENYGQINVAHAQTGNPLSRVYVKVFARRKNGSVRFHKDGYTDLRGRFDYASLSGTGAQDANRYAILVLSEQAGAVIREVSPPVE